MCTRAAMAGTQPPGDRASPSASAYGSFPWPFRLGLAHVACGDHGLAPLVSPSRDPCSARPRRCYASFFVLLGRGGAAAGPFVFTRLFARHLSFVLAVRVGPTPYSRLASFACLYTQATAPLAAALGLAPPLPCRPFGGRAPRAGPLTDAPPCVRTSPFAPPKVTPRLDSALPHGIARTGGVRTPWRPHARVGQACAGLLWLSAPRLLPRRLRLAPHNVCSATFGLPAPPRGPQAHPP